MPAAAGHRPSEAHRNPHFLDYLQRRGLKLSPSDAAQATAGHQLGLIPSTIDFSYLKQSRSTSQATTAVLPAAYDLRTLGKVSPVKDQGVCGVCWAFATYGSLESGLLPGESLIFSENNLKDLHGFDACPCDPTCSGGNWQMSAAYLTRWSGPVTAADDPYQQTNINSSPTNLAQQKHVQDIEFIMARVDSTDNAKLKSAVMVYGGLYVPMYIDLSSAYYNPGTAAFYFNGANVTAPNHSVTLIGWDDNFDAKNFATPAPGNGAFLAKNSWGTSFGQQGFFWISYFDKIFASSMSVAFASADPVTNYDNEYEYDPLGLVANYGYSDQSAQFANIFTASATERVVAVATYFATDNAPYTINVYTDATSGPTSGALAASITGVAATAGYHTIALPAPVPVTAGQKFSVVVQLTTPLYGFPIPAEVAVAGYSSHATASAGQGYLSHTGASWIDATAVNSTLSVALKAFTVISGITVTSPDGGEAWRVGSTHPITWNSKGVTGDVNIDLVQGGVLSQTIATVPVAAGTYTWKIPVSLAPGSYSIRVQSVSDPTILDDSNAPFSITPAGVTVVSPNGGETWVRGTMQTIQWSSVGLTGNVNVALLKDGTGYKSLATNVPITQGSLNWTVPMTLPLGSTYAIRVMTTDLTFVDISDSTFTVVPPSVTVVSPNGGESWPQGSLHTIQWSSIGVTGNVNIALLKNGSGFMSIATNVPVAQGSINWTIPPKVTAESVYTIRVMTTDGKYVDVSDAAFTVQPASVTVVSPNAGEFWTLGTTHAIQWSSVNLTGNVNVALMRNGSGYLSIATNVPVTQESLNWTVPLSMPPDSTYKIRVMTTNGFFLDVSDSNFTLTTSSVTVVAPNGSESWAQGTTHSIQWNSTSLTGNVSVALLKGGSGLISIASSVPVTPGSLNWTVPSNVPVGSDYTIRVMTSDGKLADVSNASFSIAPPLGTVTVVAPNGGETWQVGSTHTIQWNSTNLTGNVSVTLMKAGSGYKSIASSVAVSPGSFTWVVPALPAASDYTVRVLTADGTTVDVSNGAFSITP